MYEISQKKKKLVVESETWNASFSTTNPS